MVALRAGLASLAHVKGVINYGILMNKLIFSLAILFFTPLTNAAQWIQLTSSDIQSIQIVQAENSHEAPEGLYIGLNSPIEGEAASYCSSKTFVVVTDQKLIDRVYSGLLFSMSTQKSFKFYI